MPGAFLPGIALVQPGDVFDNSYVCAPIVVTPGETTHLTIDNVPPPGGMAKTIGFWKNWASCASSKGKQGPVLDETLALAPIAPRPTRSGPIDLLRPSPASTSVTSTWTPASEAVNCS